MADREKVGDVYVDVSADLDDFEERLRKKLQRLGEKMGEKLSSAMEEGLGKEFPKRVERIGERAGAKLHDALSKASDRAGRAMVEHLAVASEEVKRQLDDIDDTEMKPEVQPEVSLAASRLTSARLSFLSRARAALITPILTGAAKFQADMVRVMRGISGASFVERFYDSLINFASNLPQMIAKWSLLAAAIGSIVLPAMDLLTVLAPLGRSLWSIWPVILQGPALFALFGAQIGVLALAFSGLEDATRGPAVAFKRMLEGFSDDFAQLKAVVQDGFFNSFTEPLESFLAGILPQLTAGMGDLAPLVGGALGAMLTGITESLGDDGLATLFSQISDTVTRMTPGLQAFASAFTNILIAGGEHLPAIGDWVTQIGERFLAWTENTDIAALISEASRQFGFLLDVVGQVGGIIAGIFRSMDIGQSTGLESMAATLERVHAIVDSPQFQSTMQTIFQGAAIGASQLGQALGPIGDMFTALSPGIASLLALVGSGAGQMFTNIANALSTVQASSALTEIGEALNSVMTGLDWSFLSPTLSAIAGIFTALAPAVTTIVNTITPFLPAIGNAIAGLGGFVSSVLEPLSRYLLGIGEALGLVEGNFGGVEGAMQGFTDLQAALLTGLDGLLDGLATAAEVYVRDILPQMADALPGVLDRLLSNLQTLMPGIIEGGGRLLTALAEGFTTAVPLFQQAIVDIIPLVIETLATLYPVILTAGMEVLTALIMGFQTAMPALTETWRQIAPQIVEGIRTGLPILIEGISVLMQELIPVMHETMPTIAEAAMTLIPYLVQMFNTIGLPLLLQVGFELLRAMIPGLLQAFPSILQQLMQLLPVLVNGLMGFMPQIISAAVTVIGAIARGIGPAIPGILSTLVSLLGPALTSGIMRFVVQMVNGGRDLINGLVRGLRGAAGAVTDTLLNIAQGAINAFKNFFGIASPSKLMIEQAGFIGDGLVKGLLGARSGVLAAMDRLMEPLAEQAQVQITANVGARLAGMSDLSGVGVGAAPGAVQAGATGSRAPGDSPLIGVVNLQGSGNVGKDLQDLWFYTRAYGNGSRDDGTL